MNISRIFAVFSLAMLACSSSSQDKGLEGTGEGTTAETAPDQNPYGVAYPTQNIGTNARIGTRSGNTIQNFKFLGYPNADKSGGLQPMSLANFFDPEAREYKIIHIQASGVWCTYCQKETEVVVPLVDKLKAKKVVWLVSLAEGPTPGTPSKQADLDRWIASFKSPFTHFLDPGNKNLGVFYDAAALPWNANINAKTMEILQAGTGAHTSEAAIMNELDKWLEQIDNGKIQ